MTTCFVMQQFDGGGTYDTRYDETFGPAISKGGAMPLRADKILGTTPIIDKIEKAIREATIAFAEISENNPNVFIELGFALEIGIPLVMVCDQGVRSRLPFDIQHRPVIFYQTRSQGDFSKLSNEIEVAVGAALSDAQQRSAVRGASQRTPNTVAPDELKNAILLHILEVEIGSPTGASAYGIRSSMTRFDYSEQISSLAILSLTKEGMINLSTEVDRNGEPYSVYTLTENGRDHMLAQYATLKRGEEKLRLPKPAPQPKSGFADDLDDDVPF